MNKLKDRHFRVVNDFEKYLDIRREILSDSYCSAIEFCLTTKGIQGYGVDPVLGVQLKQVYMEFIENRIMELELELSEIEYKMENFKYEVE